MLLNVLMLASASLTPAVLGAGDVEQPWWYLKIGRNIQETAKVAGVIEERLDVVWDRVKDFGSWSFVQGMTTVCVHRDSSNNVCMVRNVTMEGIEFGGYRFGQDSYLERVIDWQDGWLKKVITYERDIPATSPLHGKFEATMTFELMVDPSDPFGTIVEQSAQFRKEHRNINPMAKELGELGFLFVIDSLRLSFEGDSRWTGYANVCLKHELFRDLIKRLTGRETVGDTVDNGMLVVVSSGRVFEETIHYDRGFKTCVKAGFDQKMNGRVDIKILSDNGAGHAGRQVLCSTTAQMETVTKSIEFNDTTCSNVAVKGWAELPSLVAKKIFETQRKGFNLFELFDLAQAGGQELIAFGQKSVNEMAASIVTGEIIPMEALQWATRHGNYSSIPLHSDKLAYQHYGLSVDHLMVLLQGHVDWFASNLQPLMMGAKALSQPDPWTNWLIPQSSRLDMAWVLSERWGDDDEFCRQFMQGANPLQISRISSLSDATRIIPRTFETQKLINFATIGDFNTIRYYYVDYSEFLVPILDGIPEGNILYPNTFILFRSADESVAPLSRLEVVGIQLKSGGVVYHKDSGMPWRYLAAKMWVNNADMQAQEFLWHLGLAHFLSESFITSVHNAFHSTETCEIAGQTVCKIDDAHPIYRLLKPHFKYTLGMDSLARLILGGRSTDVADFVFAAGHKGVLDMINHWYDKFYSFDTFDIFKQLQNRGIKDDDLPKYYYRDDMIELWGILKKYCEDVVNSAYADDQAVLKDEELKNFAHISAKSVRGFPSVIMSKEQLVQALTNIIATPVILHTATNYAQAPYNYFPVNRPFRLLKKMEDFTEQTDFTPEFINEMLPTFPQQMITGMFMHVLTIAPDNSLMDTATDESVFSGVKSDALKKGLEQAQQEFARDLEILGDRINKRSDETVAKGNLPYPYFHPSVTCTSTNI